MNIWVTEPLSWVDENTIKIELQLYDVYYSPSVTPAVAYYVFPETTTWSGLFSEWLITSIVLKASAKNGFIFGTLHTPLYSSFELFLFKF